MRDRSSPHPALVDAAAAAACMAPHQEIEKRLGTACSLVFYLACGSFVCRYAENERLQSLANLVIVGGVIDPSQTVDREEADECRKMHSLIEEHNMHGNFRWIVAQKNRVRNGELYRFIADRRGAFGTCTILPRIVSCWMTSCRKGCTWPTHLVLRP